MENLIEITAYDANFKADNIWMMVSTFLVFIMHLGFATLESGMTQSKNTTNILFKNTLIPAIGLLTYACWGFNTMYPGEWQVEGILGFGGPVGGFSPEDMGIGYAASDPDPITGLITPGGYTAWTDFLFQGMFAATAATIVSGAVAERVKLFPFLIFSVLFVGIIYPIFGSWSWGGGIAGDMHDFAGSTIVHSIGGWGALAGAIVLGPRIGKFVDGRTNPIPGHSLPLAVIGVFLLWLGWFGFNGGSVLNGDPEGTSFVLVTTCLAAAAGAITAPVMAFFLTKKADLTMALNGILAGLVGITAGADVVSPLSATVIGGIAGFLVVGAVLLFDSLKIDDPVGAISVHLVCGMWGTIAVALFDMDPANSGITMGGQFTGIALAAVLAFPAALIIFYALKFTTGIRVSKEEEVEGLDIGEHGMSAYKI